MCMSILPQKSWTRLIPSCFALCLFLSFAHFSLTTSSAFLTIGSPSRPLIKSYGIGTFETLVYQIRIRMSFPLPRFIFRNPRGGLLNASNHLECQIFRRVPIICSSLLRFKQTFWRNLYSQTTCSSTSSRITKIRSLCIQRVSIGIC